MKKQVCSSLLALTMALGTVTPALAAEIETNVQPAACTCTAACTEETRNMDCAVCGAEGAPLTDCAQVAVQDDTNEESQAINAENGFAYTVTGDEATITGYTGSAKNIVIPSELGGKPVTAIADKAFYGYGKMRDIYIPKTVKTIGENAFQNAASTDEADSWIQFICYEGTEKEWANIAIQEGNNAVKPDDAHFRIGVYECSLSGDMVYQASDDAANFVRYFGTDSKVKIPAELGGKPVTEIGEWAFAYYSSLTEVTIPEGVTSIGKGAFSPCSSLTEVTIPKSVTSIGEWAFEGCSNLTKVIISEGVTSIGGGAFRACRSLTEVTIPKSVTSIGPVAFYDCGALATVYYGGTQEDWDALKKNIGDNNTPLLNANIICAIQESNGFAYTVTGDEATITGYTGSAKNIVIPSELGGKPVTAIADKAFEGYKNIVTQIASASWTRAR